MTITTTNTQQAASLLTPSDVLDIQSALGFASNSNCTRLNAEQRQALSLLTYDRNVCKALASLLIERVIDGTYPLPLDNRRADLLSRLSDRLPAVAQEDVDAWLAVRDTEAPCQHGDERPDLADVPHSITVEPISHEMRRNDGLPAAAQLVAVERHHGRLAKVCAGVTDVAAADVVEYAGLIPGQYTIEDAARGVAATYGATYVEAAPAVNA